MKKITASSLLIMFFNMYINGQERVYFDYSWHETNPDKMEYYRVAEKKGELTLVNYFYKNGQLLMDALVSDATPNYEIYEGRVTMYNPEGVIVSMVTYLNGYEDGPTQKYDEKGRLLEDLIFKNGNFSKGKIYEYKDPEAFSFYNSITTFENSKTFKKIVYDEDVKGIRYEITTDSKGKYETKYYDDKGKHIGTSNAGCSDDNLVVEYYYDPMKVSKIKKYKADGTIKEGVTYSKSGKVLQEEKKNIKDGYKMTFDETGKKIGTLTYVYDKESDSYMPQDGEDYQFSDDISCFYSIDVYKNSSMILSKNFDRKGKLYSEKVLEDEMVQEVRYYQQDGELRSILTYQDGMPYNGTFYDQDVEQQYENGILFLSKTLREDGKIKSEKKLNVKETGYDSVVFDAKGTIIYTYTQTMEETAAFTAEIVQYVKGKSSNKAAIKEGVLQSGKIKYQSGSGLKELERSEKWILVKIYNREGKLLEDFKFNVNSGEKDIENILAESIQENDLLYEF